MEKLRQYYETLGIKPGASLDEIKQAYRDSVSVWHPDRFANNERLQQKAQEKLKDINESYEKLNAFFRDYGNPNFSNTNKTEENTYQDKSSNNNNQPPPNEPPKSPRNPSGTSHSTETESQKGGFLVGKSMRYLYAIIACFVVLMLAAAIKGLFGWGPSGGGALPALVIATAVFVTWFVITTQRSNKVWGTFLGIVLVIGITGVIVIPQLKSAIPVPPGGYKLDPPANLKSFTGELDPAQVVSTPPSATKVDIIDQLAVFTDTRSGLMWSRNGNIAGKGMNWKDATSWVKNLNYSGYSNWRLPTKEELEVFAARGGNRPSDWFNANGFNSVQESYYWSSSTYTNGTKDAWFVYMDGGYVSHNDKAKVYYVWPVRSGR